MKCIPDCGFQSKPDNLKVLTRHIEDCLSTGACRRLKKDPFVVWRDGEFTVIEKKPLKKDRVFPVELIHKKPIELTEDKIKTAAEVAQAHIKGVNATMLAPAINPGETRRRPEKRIQAEFKEGGI